MKLFAAIAALFSRPTTLATEEQVDKKLVPPQPVLDPKIQAVRKIATLRLAYRPLPLQLLEGMSECRLEWIRTLDVPMLMLLGNATQAQIREHLAGRRSIRGLLAADPDSVAAYKEAIKPKSQIIDHNERRGGGGGPKRSFAGPR